MSIAPTDTDHREVRGFVMSGRHARSSFDAAQIIGCFDLMPHYGEWTLDPDHHHRCYYWFIGACEFPAEAITKRARPKFH